MPFSFIPSFSLFRLSVHPSIPVLLIGLVVIIRAVPEATNNVSGWVSDAAMPGRRHGMIRRSLLFIYRRAIYGIPGRAV